MVRKRDALLDCVAETIRRYRMLQEAESLLVAVSGGPDSVALAAALQALGLGQARRVVLAHVNHGLRGRASEADARFVRRLGDELGLEVIVLAAPIRPGADLEARARESRYRCLHEAASGLGGARIATAHTLDDQAETLLMRLLRGAGGGGLGGIAAVRADGVVRPLIRSTRDEILAFLVRRNLRFRTDSTNRDTRYSRNRVRLRLLPLLEREFNPGVKRVLARTTELLREDEIYLDSRVDAALRRVVVLGELDAKKLLKVPGALRGRMVRRWWRLVAARELEQKHVEAILSLTERGRGSLSLPGGIATASRGRVRGGSPEPREAAGFFAPLIEGRALRRGAWKITVRRVKGGGVDATRWRALIDPFALNGRQLAARTPRRGDRLRPIGLHGSKKLQDVFVDAKVPVEDRATWPVVHAGREILWLPGLVRAEGATVSKRTPEVLVVEARRVRPADGVAAKNLLCYGHSGRSKARQRHPSLHGRLARKEPN